MTRPNGTYTPNDEPEVGVVEGARLAGDAHPVAFAEKLRRGTGPVAYKDGLGRWKLKLSDIRAYNEKRAKLTPMPVFLDCFAKRGGREAMEVHLHRNVSETEYRKAQAETESSK